MPATFTSIADDARAFFETASRDDATTYTRLKDDAPQWLRDLVREAHGDLLPDDHVFEWVSDAVEWISDAGEDADLEDLAHEFADDVDVYNSDLLKWVGSHSIRMSYCDDAMQELGHPDDLNLARILMLGQSAERREIFETVARGIEAQTA